MRNFESGDRWSSLFEEERATVTVTSERYVQMIRNFLRPQLRSLRVNMEEMWFQQDGATAHTANVSATRSLAFRRCPLPPTLTRFICLRFLSLGLPQIKSLRSKTSYSRRSESYHSRRNCNCATKKKMLVNVMQNFEERLRMCVRKDAIFPI